MYQIPQKIVQKQRDELHLGGNPYDLYIPARTTDATALPCDCLRSGGTGSDLVGSGEPDTKCPKCYGVGLAPGYFKFLHETVYWFSGEYASFTFTNTQRTITHRSPQLTLADNALSGTIETQDKAFANPGDDDWEYEAKVFRLDNPTGVESGFAVEFSTDSGGTWHDIATINGVDKPIGAGTLRLRVTLTRSTLDIVSPAVSIVRLRHLRSLDANSVPIDKQATATRPLLAGQILMLKTWQAQQWSSLEDRGILEELESDRSSTTGLSYFDTSITANTPADIIRTSGEGVPPFVVERFGIFDGQIHALIAPKYSQELDTLMQQEFAQRRAQEGEILYRVW